MTWFLDLRADSAGGNPASEITIRRSANDRSNIADLIKDIRGRDLLFGTHGFNVNREEGVNSLSAWANLLNLGGSTLFIGVLWPGDSRWLPVVDYPFEGCEATASGQMLAPFIDKNLTGAASISFVSHSLGARMVLETVRQLRRPVRRLFLMAGAIGDNCLIAEYQDAAAKIKEISLLASHEDYVLKLAFPVGNLAAEIITTGHPYWQSAVGYDGPDNSRPANLHAGWQIPDNWDYGHGDYLGDASSALQPNVDIPPDGSPLPSSKPAWSAGFISTRFR